MSDDVYTNLPISKIDLNAIIMHAYISLALDGNHYHLNKIVI